MGMSASQGRLLSLTARMSDLELQGQSINHAKLRLANQSTDASNQYMDALDKQKLTVYNDMTNTYIDASVYNLTTFNAISESTKSRIVTDAAGRVIISQEVADAYEAAKATQGTNEYVNRGDYPTLESYLERWGFTPSDDGNNYTFSGTHPDSCVNNEQKMKYEEDRLNYLINRYDGAEDFLRTYEFTSRSEKDGTLDGYESNEAATFHYQNLFEQIEMNGYTVLSNTQLQDPEWLQSQIESGNIFLMEYNRNGGSEGLGAWEEYSWSTGDSQINTKSDETAIARAEAEYEVTMKRIENQEKRLDMELTEINTEHSAIQTEIESVKKVIGNNIERTFKTFNG